MKCASALLCLLALGCTAAPTQPYQAVAPGPVVGGQSEDTSAWAGITEEAIQLLADQAKEAVKQPGPTESMDWGDWLKVLFGYGATAGTSIAATNAMRNRKYMVAPSK